MMSVETALTTAFMVLVSVVGTAGNALVILAILSKRRLRNIPNYFILDLAVCDLLTVSLSVPLRLVEGFQSGSVPCSVVIAVTILFDGLSRINIIFVSIDRLIAVKFPFAYKALMTPATVAIFITSGWIIMAIFALLPILGVGLAPAEFLRQNQGLCFFSTNLSTAYLLVYLIGFCLLPLVLATPINCFLLKAPTDEGDTHTAAAAREHGKCTFTERKYLELWWQPSTGECPRAKQNICLKTEANCTDGNNFS